MRTFHKKALCALLLLISCKYTISESLTENPSLFTCLPNKIAACFNLYKEQLQAQIRLAQRKQELISLKDRNLLSDAKYLYKQICYLSPEDKLLFLTGSTAIIIIAYIIYCDKNFLEKTTQQQIEFDDQNAILTQQRHNDEVKSALQRHEAKTKLEQFILEVKKQTQDMENELASNKPKN